MTDADLTIASDAEEAAAHAAALLAGIAREHGTIALAGGSTPRRAYDLAAGLTPDWGGTTICLGDERCVPASDERSNQRLVREALLDHLAAPPAALWVDTSLPPLEAAAAYDRALRGVSIDLALLGLGGDGHTASLFPGSPALDEREALAVSTAPGLAPWVERITLTVPALSSAAHVVFLAVGADKADAARRAFADPPSPATPASLVRSSAGPTTVILDRAAAARL